MHATRLIILLYVVPKATIIYRFDHCKACMQGIYAYDPATRVHMQCIHVTCTYLKEYKSKNAWHCTYS